MPKQTFALEPNGPKNLEISWKGIWKDITVKLDDNVLGTIPGQKELKEGREFMLPDGTQLNVQLVQKFSGTELQVLRNGEPLPGSASDPETRFKTAYGIVFFVAGLNILLSLVALVFQVEFLQAAGIGLFSIIFGLVFLGLGFWARSGSLVALLIAIVLFTLDGLVGLAGAIAAGYSPSIGGLVARVFLLIPMVQGIGAIRALKEGTP